MEEREITTRHITFAILVVLVLIGGFIGADRLLDLVNKKREEKIEVKVPDVEQVATTTVVAEPKEEKLQLLKERYSPPQDIYSNADYYKKFLIQWALMGDFATAKIIVKGEVKNTLHNFVSLSLADVSGTLGGSRKSETTLDFDNTTAVFTKNKPLEFVLDLKSPVKLSTTREEFLSTYEASKNVILWDHIAPPPEKGTLAKMVIAPYSSRGKYGDGTDITSVGFQYSCVEGSECKAALCPKENYRFGSECIRDLFGIEAASNYTDYFRNR